LLTLIVLIAAGWFGYHGCVNYFAYGSNMDLGQIAERCHGAAPVGRALAEGWEFRINTHGVASIIPGEGGVHGLLWQITAEHD
jgi:hypothetical protein